ncbi:hypothetical protein [sulfur-oxidizing endosymbiont of Gigantopelta aegis]|uniref:hypothetical protein n=1 Tax=sulfur-oxidizing endosymbiont of Gigantopelta aegis TaxID=2794934 RepID=UPI0018DE0336|nr:hypothetical protein [sulfur-oxidizing endosymbiont of Gigantopelta aegis]
MKTNVLQYNAGLLIKQLAWLQHSYEQAKSIGLKDSYSMADFDIFENLSSRFARSTDFLIRKVFRSIDEAEFEPQGTLIDVVNNAHKRHLFENIEDIRAIKDLRNSIAHEYIDEELEKLFAELLDYSERLIFIAKTTLKYIESHHP